jgi:hypothetical protein
MRTLFAILMILLVLSTITPVSAGTPPEKNNIALVFGFRGFATTEVAPVNGGVGLVYYIDQATALRGSLAMSRVSGEQPNPQTYTVSVGLVNNLLYGTNTTLYGCVDVLYAHSEPAVVNSYGADIGIGAAYMPWESVEFSAEYQLTFLRNEGEKLSYWSLGLPSNSINLLIYFNR